MIISNNLKENELNNSFVDENGNIFTPRGMLSGQEVYQEWLNNKNYIKEPSEQEKINAQLLEEIAQQKIVNAQLMQEIADLKGGNANV